MNFILSLCLILMVAILYLAWYAIKKSKLEYKLHNYISRVAYTSPGLAGLWHQLLIRVNFDVAKAESLVKQLKQKYPNKTDRELIEKAIWIIEGQKSRQRH